jgi:hypothetical protein
MRRRAFLATLAVSPLWVRRAFSDVCVTTPMPGRPSSLDGDERALRDALARGRRLGRPLLVIVVPPTEPPRRAREVAVSEWLLRAGDDAIVPLGGAEVVAAPADKLRAAGLGVPEGNLLLLRVDPTGDVRARAAPAEGRDLKPALVTAVRDLLPPPAHPLERSDWLARARRLRSGPMPGANWQYTLGCGHGTPHDASPSDDETVIGCGMGSLGGESRRFLHFYVAAR